ncbi:MAG: YciI family protein [Acidobacteriaceae bacterium]
MKYLCIVFLDEAQMDAMSDADRKELDRQSLAYDVVLQARGHFVAAEALQSRRRASCVRRRDGEFAVTDGPFIETNEYIGGFILIDARDQEEAIAIAKEIPVARLGGVEVRPIQSLA